MTNTSKSEPYEPSEAAIAALFRQSATGTHTVPLTDEQAQVLQSLAPEKQREYLQHLLKATQSCNE